MIKIRRCENFLICKIYGVLRTFFKVLFSVVLTLLVTFVGVTSYKTIDPFDKGYETQDFLGYQMLNIASNSMYPLINVGDGVMIKIVEDDTEINQGDIIAYRLGKHIIVHRVEQVVGYDSYVTKGDNNDVNDGNPIPRTDVMGVYKFHIKGIDGLLQYVRSPLGIVLFLILVASVVFFFDYAFRIPDTYFRYSKDLEDEDEEVGDEEDE